jgi:hypothetical protein
MFECQVRDAAANVAWYHKDDRVLDISNER